MADGLLFKELPRRAHWARPEKRHNNPLLIASDIAPGRVSASAQVTFACDADAWVTALGEGRKDGNQGAPGSGSPELRVFGFGLLVDGNVGVGVFPQCEEILIRGAGFIAGSRVFAGVERVGASQAQAGQRSPGKVRQQSVVVEELLKLDRR